MESTTPLLTVLVWHVHGSWTTSFVQGRHRYLLPVLAGDSHWGRGRGERAWPDSAVDVPVSELANTPVDVVVLQRLEELELAQRWLRRSPGKDVPAVYVEHNAPRGPAATTRHPLAGREDIPVAHVTHFNELMWDNGIAPTVVVPHGLPDPGHQYTGELPSAVTMINEPLRRWRVTGTDLLPAFAEAAPIDVFGTRTETLSDLPGAGGRVRGRGDLKTADLHREAARRRVYLHTARWTSLGFSLLEAMHLGLPIVALGTTESTLAVPPDAGVLSTDVTVLANALRELVHEPDFAALTGKSAREFALRHFGLSRFLDDWDRLLAEVTR
ncbi:glycosyltransferase [Amycolatopsis sp. cg5]|uniref:glycosyltransferase n=1 Tax=Amycolatopsis sp. cg5 TaxID=3238802 RepID=UPI003523182E